MGKLENKVCIITGASSGIGREIANSFSREGAKLILAARRLDKLDGLANELKKGDDTTVVQTDVSNEKDITNLFEITKQKYNQLDIVVNNAGIFDGGSIESLSLETWSKTITVNLTGVFLCTREAFKIMKPQKNGRIINIGSISGQMPRMNSAPYTSSKHGLIGLTKSSALEGRAHGISVGCLNPGNVLTEWRDDSAGSMHQEPMMDTSAIAEAALTMAAMPPEVNMLDTTVLPIGQLYIGRG
jgi:NAD(P)-dependent dehydrogenase (short-subunit alcohol dehydrogenase family)